MFIASSFQPGLTITSGALQRDMLPFVIGALTVGIALLSLTVFFVRKQRTDRTPLWLGIFAGMYGLRLLLASVVFQSVAGISTGTAATLTALITFTIQVPGTIYALKIIDAMETRIAKVALGLAWSLAVVGCAALAVGRGVGAVFTLNNVLVLTVFIPIYFWLYWKRRADGFLGVKIGFAIFITTVIIDNAAGIVRGDGLRLEPLGFIVLLVTLTNMTARHTIASEDRLRTMEREMAIAQTIQRSILPEKLPEVGGLELAVRYEPMMAVAGDFYDFVKLEDGRLGILVADVSGHGVPAALIASMLKMAFVSNAADARDPADLLARLNRALCGRFQSHFVTAVYAIVETGTGRMTFSGAAHPAILVKRAGGPVESLEENGLMLGAFSFASYKVGEAQLRPGDQVLFYTDGLVEGSNGSGDEFGIERVQAAFETGAEATMGKLFSSFATWTKGTQQGDDLTAVSLRLG